MVSGAWTYDMNRWTIGTIYKQKDRIIEHVKIAVGMQSTIISKKRGNLSKRWRNSPENQRQRRVSLSFKLIQEKVRSIFEDLQAEAGESAAEETFSASRSWFARFKKRANLHQVAVTGEAVSADKAASKRSPQELKEIIEKEGYSAKQIFNVDSSRRKCQKKIYISCEERTMPEFKAAKDRLILMLGKNADSTFKLKPLLVYGAANPRAQKNLTKFSFPVTAYRCPTRRHR